MEDFITDSRNLSPELLTITSNPRLTFTSPVASVYSNASDQDGVHGGWSPPPWRKNGTGFYNHWSSGLTSPPRSRGASPLVEEDEEDADDIDILTASRIALPESPMKGRSEERSLSPEILSSSAQHTAYLTPPPSQEQPKRSADKDARWTVRATENNCEFLGRRSAL